MNSKQRRRLHRIWEQNQKNRTPNSAAQQFIKKHAAPPSRVCVMTDPQSKRFQDVSIGHRCTATDHRHYTRRHIEILVARGELVWVGQHHKIAAWTNDKTWQKVYNRNKAGEVIHCGMQLISGRR